MALEPGTRLGRYVLAAPLGAGGMGEVYRARDTRLDRDVAIKVLPAHLSEDPSARARFESEARSVSALNHPHIGTLHDVGHDHGIDFLVLELIEGETLAARLARGPLPQGEVLRIGAQVADALDRAHRAGVVHRDLKPANIMLARSGAKLLDFGLARRTRRADGDAATMAEPHTAEGTIVGTFRYMAPEQVEGRDADARSDLWALGCVLYEMVTGTPAFAGESQASLIAAILKDAPRPLSERAPVTPPSLDRAVQLCLAKDPDDRWQSAGDLKRELEWIAGGSASIATPGSRARDTRLPWALATVFALLAGALALASRFGGGTPSRPAFEPLSYRPLPIFRAAFAPDGKTIVYSAAPQGNTARLFVLRPENPEPMALGDSATHLLSVSSKGELAVLTGARYLAHRLFVGTLARMPLGGGAPRQILENVRDAEWAPDGSEVAIIRDVDGKDRIEFPIGHVMYESAGYVSDLRFSPRGDRIAFFEHPARFDDRGSVNVVDLAGRKTMLSDGYFSEQGIAWSRDGSEVLFSASVGGFEPVIYGVTLLGGRREALRSAGGITIHDVGADGSWLTTRDEQSMRVLVHRPGWEGDRDLSYLDLSLFAHLSGDARTLVFTDQSRPAGLNYRVCLRRTDGGEVTILGEGRAMDLTDDGTRVLASIPSPARVVIYPTGAGEPLYLDRGPIESFGLQGNWFPGDDSVLFGGNEPGKGGRLYVQRLDGSPPRPVTPEGTRFGVLSGNGAFLLALKPHGTNWVFPVNGDGEPRPVPGFLPGDQVIRTTGDGQAAFVAAGGFVPTPIERVDLQNGSRTRIAEFAPPDRAGVLRVFPTSMTEDASSYAYWAWWMRSTLYRVTWTK